MALKKEDLLLKRVSFKVDAGLLSLLEEIMAEDGLSDRSELMRELLRKAGRDRLQEIYLINGARDRFKKNPEQKS